MGMVREARRKEGGSQGGKGEGGGGTQPKSPTPFTIAHFHIEFIKPHISEIKTYPHLPSEVSYRWPA